MPSAIGLTEPMNQALARTGFLLFKPFRLKKWMLWAFPAALMLVGLGYPPSLTLAFEIAARTTPSFSLDDALAWYQANTAAILGGMSALVLLVFFPLYMLCRWLNGRAYMVFFDMVVTDQFEMKQSWKENRELGNSLMKMIITWELMAFNLWLVALIIAALFAIPDIKHLFAVGEYRATGWTVAALLVFLLEMIAVMVASWFISSVLYLLAVPVMYIRKMKAREAMRVAWRELFLPNNGPCLRFFLMNILVTLVKGSVTSIGLMALALVTLCLACGVVYVPFVGNYPLALASLPATTFEAAFRLYFVSQFGEEYRIAWSEMAAAGGGFPVTASDAGPSDAPLTQ